MGFILEIYKLLFIASTIFIIYCFFDLIMKIVGRFYFKRKDIVYDITRKEKLLLWISLTIFFTYLF